MTEEQKKWAAAQKMLFKKKKKHFKTPNNPSRLFVFKLVQQVMPHPNKDNEKGRRGLVVEVACEHSRPMSKDHDSQCALFTVVHCGQFRFENTINILIALNSVMMAMTHYNQSETFTRYFLVI